MPVLSWAHSKYWQAHEPEPPVEAGASADGGYIPWQTTVIFGSGFGAMQVVWMWVVDQVKAHGNTR